MIFEFCPFGAYVSIYAIAMGRALPIAMAMMAFQADNSIALKSYKCLLK
jgi:hypothetical protein